MPESEPPILNSPQQLLRLERFIGTGMPVMGVLAVLFLVLWRAFGSWILLSQGLSLAVASGLSVVAARQVRRGRPKLGLTILSGINLYFVLLCTWQLGPAILPIMVLLALWPVMVALPYVKGRDLVLRMAASAVVAMIGSLLALRPDPFDVAASLPGWVLPSVNVLCVGPYLGFSCWLLWQYSKGLNETVDELRESERLLEEKVELRTRELADKNEQLVKLDTIKSQFLSNASHELRTPLTSIRAFSELLLDGGELDDTQREFATIINAESERLNRLTTRLLDLSRIETGAVAWHPRVVDLRPEIDGLLRAYRPLAERKQLDLLAELDEDLPPITFDPDGLHQVLANLLTNALKFTQRGSIRISAGRRGQLVAVAVSDTGPGIGDDDQERVFEPFYQVGDVLTDKPSGAGLGLAISRAILEQHDSRLRLTSELGRGSSFEFEIAVAS